MIMQTVNSLAERTSGMSYDWPDEPAPIEEWEPDLHAHRLFEEHMHMLEAIEFDKQRAVDELLESAEAQWASEDEEVPVEVLP